MLEEAIVLPHFRISDVVTRHASGPQDESDDEDEPDDMDDESPLAPNPNESELLAAARRRWELAAPSDSPLPATASSSSSPNVIIADPAETSQRAQNAKKTKLHRKSRKAKREALREVPGKLKGPKAIVLQRVRQTSPIPVDFRMQSPSVPVTSSGWMGLRDPPPQPFEPENHAYTLEEAQVIPGMRVLDWHRCVSSHGVYPF
jgi:hypothetical protein